MFESSLYDICIFKNDQNLLGDPIDPPGALRIGQVPRQTRDSNDQHSFLAN